MHTQQHYIGIMSGTSMDGVDAVLISMNGSHWQAALAHAFTPYCSGLKNRLLELQNSSTDELHRSQMLGLELADLYAQTAKKLLTQTGMSATDITAIGCHGQTVRHAPEHGYSVQLVNLAALAAQTGIFTVGDFRSGDLAVGGQGAPLVPAFHHALFAASDETRVLLNIGGIANISVLRPNEAPFGFDTGPGNMLMDAWTNYIWQEPYDEDGRRASYEGYMPGLLNKLSAHPYFRLPYPKSTGRELFSLDWLHDHLNGCENPASVLRTLVQLTNNSIVDAIVQAAPDARSVYVCGGGIRNSCLMHNLKYGLLQKNIQIHSTDELQLNPQWVEAAAFGWLAACWVNRIPSNPHRATGAQRPMILGAGYYG